MGKDKRNSTGVKEWHKDPVLEGKFHSAEYPNDLQVVVHDGGPRVSNKRPELVWVTVTGKDRRAYKGIVLNQPNALETIRRNDEIRFLAIPSFQYPFLVTEKYLEERDNWEITPCNKCGFSELFDAPSDLIKATEPSEANSKNLVLMNFTAFCPICGGVQVIASKESQAFVEKIEE